MTEIEESFPLETSWACDFETTTEVDYIEEGRVRVYLWHARSLDDSDREAMGYDIQSFIEWLTPKSCGVKLCIFHNLKFDGSFILDYCLRNGWQYGVPQQRSTKKFVHRSVDTLITDLGQWMSVTLKFGDHVVKFMDSAKKFPGMSLERLAKEYGIEGKSELDVHKRRPLGTPVTDEEITRVKGDTRILRVAMKDVLSSGRRKLTMASDAKQWFSDSWRLKFGNASGSRWARQFPPLPVVLEQLFRKAHMGGWVYLNKRYREKVIEDVHVYDVNSMYPSKMIWKLPAGPPMHRMPREGECCLMTFSSSFRLKPGKLPFLHVRKSMYDSDSEFIIESDGIMDLVLCEVDFKLFEECYDVDFVSGMDYWSFRFEDSPFKDYIEHWMEKKVEAKTRDQKLQAKLYLNSLYGKTSENSEKRCKVPYFDEESDKVKFTIEKSEGHSWYLPAGIWICAYARTEIIHFAEKFGDRLVYSDTDSVHVIGAEVPEEMPIDSKKLGWWKHESISERAVYVGPKKYVHENVCEPGKPDDVEKLCVACAGMPEKCKEGVTMENFRSNKGRDKDDPIGKFKGKLAGKTVPGGYVLCEVDYVIRV